MIFVGVPIVSSPSSPAVGLAVGALHISPPSELTRFRCCTTLMTLAIDAYLPSSAIVFLVSVCVPGGG